VGSIDELLTLADRVIGPVDGGYGRPWMSRGPVAPTRTVVVGANAATPFPASVIERASYLDALLEGGEALRRIYERARSGGSPSPTRLNIDRLTDALERAGLGPVLETYAVPIPTPRLADLAAVNPEWRTQTRRFLADLLAIVSPAIVIVHGAEAANAAGRQLGLRIDAPSPQSYERPIAHDLPSGGRLFAIPSLSPPAANLWMPAHPGWPDEIARAIMS
jgi:hypothetical protein